MRSHPQSLGTWHSIPGGPAGHLLPRAIVLVCVQLVSAGAGEVWAQDRIPVSDVPCDSASLYAAGCAQLEADDAVGALPLLRRAVAKQPDNPRYTLKLADACDAAGQPDDAVRALQVLHRRRPDLLPTRVALARRLGDRGRRIEAAALLTEVADQLESHDLIFLVGLLEQRGDWDTVERVLRRRMDEGSPAALWHAWIESALGRDRAASALRRIWAARRAGVSDPDLTFAAARAHFALGRLLGDAEERTITGGKLGQFCGPWLLLESRPGRDRFLCIPHDSALFEIRTALDGGLDSGEAHLLHARIWRRIGKPDLAWAVLRGQAARLMENATPTMLADCAQIALEANEVDDYLRFTRARATQNPAQQTSILFAACKTAADYYAMRGDERLSFAFLRRALKLRPDHAALALKMADAEWEAGRRQRARRLYRDAVASDPKHGQYEHVLQRLAETQPETDRADEAPRISPGAGEPR